MPWKETEAMQEKEKFIRAYLTGKHSMSECCRLFGVSRETGHKMWRRFQCEGMAGLQPQSRAPKHRPHSIDAVLSQRLCELRRKHPSWGPVKLVAYLSRRESSRRWPAPSTVGELLKREGLVRKRKRRARPLHCSSDVAGYVGPNAVWCADYKGDFRCGNGKRCVPLTISDGYSRMLLRCQSLYSTNALDAKRVFTATFREFGLPDSIRTDNGCPFSSVSGLSVLSVWWVLLGIRPVRSRPGRPTENGRHERIHRTLIDDVLSFGVEKDLHAQQRAFDRFVFEYNELRPHQSLAGATPSSRYLKSTKPYPTKLREPAYANHAFVERIDKVGGLIYKGRTHQISPLLSGLPVGILCGDDGWERLYFGPLLLGHFTRRAHFKRGRPKTSTRHDTTNPTNP